MQAQRSLTVILGALASGALLLSAADLTGQWRGEVQAANGSKREVSFAFKQEGAKLTGFRPDNMGVDAISEGQVNGDTFSFVVDTSYAEQKRRSEYRGKIVGDQIEITMPVPGGGPARAVMLRRISSDPPVAPTPLPKVSLPALRALPDNGLARTPPMRWNSW